MTLPILVAAGWAALIGAAGSFAYFAAMYFGFIQNDLILERICPSSPRVKAGWRIARVFWFVSLGAMVAFVFQLPQGSNLAYIQAFIVGATWPTIVAQTLAGRQGEAPREILGNVGALLNTPVQ
jgi:hypothetical protein